MEPCLPKRKPAPLPQQTSSLTNITSFPPKKAPQNSHFPETLAEQQFEPSQKRPTFTLGNSDSSPTDSKSGNHHDSDSDFSSDYDSDESLLEDDDFAPAPLFFKITTQPRFRNMGRRSLLSVGIHNQGMLQSSVEKQQVPFSNSSLNREHSQQSVEKNVSKSSLDERSITLNHAEIKNNAQRRHDSKPPDFTPASSNVEQMTVNYNQSNFLSESLLENIRTDHARPFNTYYLPESIIRDLKDNGNIKRIASDLCPGTRDRQVVFATTTKADGPTKRTGLECAEHQSDLHSSAASFPTYNSFGFGLW